MGSGTMGSEPKDGSAMGMPSDPTAAKTGSKGKATKASNAHRKVKKNQRSNPDKSGSPTNMPAPSADPQ